MRALLAAVLAAATLAACASQPKTKVNIPEGQSLGGIRRYGVLAFADPSKSQGRAIADAVEGGLRQLFFEVAERKPIERALSMAKPDKDFGLSAEVFETIRRETGADAIIQGRMLPDWTAAVVSVYETELGDPVLRAVLRPRGKGHKHFETADEVAAELVRVLADRR